MSTIVKCHGRWRFGGKKVGTKGDLIFVSLTKK